jgi:tRNA (guanine37-N1)-methyltransferase
MKIDVLTLFPEMFSGPLSESLLKKAQEKKLLSIKITNIRDFTNDKHKTADDTPYGGGSGMVMMAAPIVAAIKNTELRTQNSEHRRAWLSLGICLFLVGLRPQYEDAVLCEGQRRPSHLALRGD